MRLRNRRKKWQPSAPSYANEWKSEDLSDHSWPDPDPDSALRYTSERNETLSARSEDALSAHHDAKSLAVVLVEAYFVIVALWLLSKLM